MSEIANFPLTSVATPSLDEANFDLQPGSSVPLFGESRGSSSSTAALTITGDASALEGQSRGSSTDTVGVVNINLTTTSESRGSSSDTVSVVNLNLTTTSESRGTSSDSGVITVQVGQITSLTAESRGSSTDTVSTVNISLTTTSESRGSSTDTGIITTIEDSIVSLAGQSRGSSTDVGTLSVLIGVSLIGESRGSSTDVGILIVSGSVSLVAESRGSSSDSLISFITEDTITTRLKGSGQVSDGYLIVWPVRPWVVYNGYHSRPTAQRFRIVNRQVFKLDGVTEGRLPPSYIPDSITGNRPTIYPDNSVYAAEIIQNGRRVMRGFLRVPYDPNDTGKNWYELQVSYENLTYPSPRGPLEAVLTYPDQAAMQSDTLMISEGVIVYTQSDSSYWGKTDSGFTLIGSP